MAVFPIPSFLQNQSVEEIHERMMKYLPSGSTDARPHFYRCHLGGL